MVTTGNASPSFTGDMETCCLYWLVQGCTGCGFLISMGVRTELRNKYKLPETPCGDCLFNCCCPCCAITQELMRSAPGSSTVARTRSRWPAEECTKKCIWCTSPSRQSGEAIAPRVNIVAATPPSTTRLPTAQHAPTRSKEKLWDALFSMIHYCGRVGVPDTVYVMFAAPKRVLVSCACVVRSEPVGWR